MIFLLMLVCQACSSGYLERTDTVSVCTEFLGRISMFEELLPAERLRGLDLLAVDLHLLNILEVFILQPVEDFLGMAGGRQKEVEIWHTVELQLDNNV